MKQTILLIAKILLLNYLVTFFDFKISSKMLLN